MSPLVYSPELEAVLKPLPPEFVELKYPDKRRCYTFPDGEQIIIYDVVRMAVSESGTHRLETADGTKYIVPKGWLAIELDTEGWTF